MESMEEDAHDIEFGEEPYTYKRLDTGLSIGAGVDYRQWQANINYSFGLRDLTTDSEFYYYKTTSSILNISVAYFIGRTE
jgi:hypothetical protein